MQINGNPFYRNFSPANLRTGIERLGVRLRKLAAAS